MKLPINEKYYRALNEADAMYPSKSEKSCYNYQDYAADDEFADDTPLFEYGGVDVVDPMYDTSLIYKLGILESINEYCNDDSLTELQKLERVQQIADFFAQHTK